MDKTVLSYSMSEIHNTIPCSWNPHSKEVFLINFLSILTEYEELDHTPQGIHLYEQVRSTFFDKGLTEEDVDHSFKLAKCLFITENIMKASKMSYTSDMLLNNAKNLLNNIEHRDEVISSFSKGMLIN